MCVWGFKKKNAEPIAEMIVSSDAIGADGKLIDVRGAGIPVDWDSAMVVKWSGPAPKLTDRLFLSPNISALVNWAFNDASTGDHFGFSRIEGPYGGRFIEVCKALNASVPSDVAKPASLKADIHFVSLSGTYNLKFGLENMRVIEPELPDHPGVPTSVRGEYLIGISDLDSFIRLNRLQNFSIAQLLEKVRNAVEAVVVRAVTRAPIELGVPISQINTATLELGQRVQSLAGAELEENYGILLRKVLLKAIEVDISSPEYMTVFELLGKKSQQAADLKSDAELKRLRSKLDAETLLDAINRDFDLEKEKAVHLNEHEMLKAQLDSSNRVSVSQLDQQAELAELKAKLESRKANEVVADAQHVVDSNEKTRHHADSLQDLKRQHEMAQLAQELNLQHQQHQLQLQEIEAQAAKLLRAEVMADAGQQAEIAKMMIEIRSMSDDASVDSQVREREIEINLSDIEDLKRRQREIYQMRAQLEAQHDFADAHGQNVSAQLGELKIKLELQKLESDRLRMATAMQSHAVKQERQQSGPKLEGQGDPQSRPAAKTADAKEFSVVTSDGKVNDYSLNDIVTLLKLNQMENIHTPLLPLNHQKRNLNEQQLRKDPAEER